MPVAVLRRVKDKTDRYTAIMVWCPGCEYELDGRKVTGLHMLPVSGNREKRPTWQWNGDLVRVTLDPSILTSTTRFDQPFTCHSFLRDGQWQFLGDCSHALVNQTVPMVELPGWVLGQG